MFPQNTGFDTGDDLELCKLVGRVQPQFHRQCMPTWDVLILIKVFMKTRKLLFYC